MQAMMARAAGGKLEPPGGPKPARALARIVPRAAAQRAEDGLAQQVADTRDHGFCSGTPGNQTPLSEAQLLAVLDGLMELPPDAFLDGAVGTPPSGMLANSPRGGVGSGGFSSSPLSPAGYGDNIYGASPATKSCGVGPTTAPVLNTTPSGGEMGPGQPPMAPQCPEVGPEEQAGVQGRRARSVAPARKVQGVRHAPPGRSAERRERNMRWLRALWWAHEDGDWAKGKRLWGDVIRRGFEYRHGIPLDETGLSIKDLINDYYGNGVEIVMSFICEGPYRLPQLTPAMAALQEKVAAAKQRRRAEQGPEEEQEEEEAPPNPTKVGRVRMTDPADPSFLPRLLWDVGARAPGQKAPLELEDLAAKCMRRHGQWDGIGRDQRQWVACLKGLQELGLTRPLPETLEAALADEPPQAAAEVAPGAQPSAAVAAAAAPAAVAAAAAPSFGAAAAAAASAPMAAALPATGQGFHNPSGVLAAYPQLLRPLAYAQGAPAQQLLQMLLRVDVQLLQGPDLPQVLAALEVVLQRVPDPGVITQCICLLGAFAGSPVAGTLQEQQAVAQVLQGAVQLIQRLDQLGLHTCAFLPTAVTAYLCSAALQAYGCWDMVVAVTGMLQEQQALGVAPGDPAHPPAGVEEVAGAGAGAWAPAAGVDSAAGAGAGATAAAAGAGAGAGAWEAAGAGASTWAAAGSQDPASAGLAEPGAGSVGPGPQALEEEGGPGAPSVAGASTGAGAVRVETATPGESETGRVRDRDDDELPTWGFRRPRVGSAATLSAREVTEVPSNHQCASQEEVPLSAKAAADGIYVNGAGAEGEDGKAGKKRPAVSLGDSKPPKKKSKQCAPPVESNMLDKSGRGDKHDKRGAQTRSRVRAAQGAAGSRG